jgi:hypothetical protein
MIDLPKVKIQARGRFVLVLVEPLIQPLSELGIEVVHDLYDSNSSLGLGWVLSAATHYYDMPPNKKTERRKAIQDGKTPEDPGVARFTQKVDMPVKVGDRICFRRFLRSQGLVQGVEQIPSIKEVLSNFPDHELVFLDVEDIIGTV